MTATHSTSLDVETIRGDFPILKQRIHGSKPLIFFDNAASSQHPQSVIDAVSQCYRAEYSNVHRGIHQLSELATAGYEESRTKLAGFLGAHRPHEVIFTSGTTASINLVARSWGDVNVKQGDEILLTLLEHHSNIVPWQQLAERTGAIIRFADITSDGQLDLESFDKLLSERTKIVAISALSNVLGTILPVAKLVEKAHAVGALTLVDAAQYVPHEPTDIQLWDADFVALSGHKMIGPSGIGALWGREELLEEMPPFLGGGSMIATVTRDGFTPGELPAKFEAGTPPIAPAIGLGAAIDYLEHVGMQAIATHERLLAQHAMKRLEAIDGVRILGPNASMRAGIVSLDVPGVSALDLAFALDRRGVAVRAGHHCAMPLHRHLGIANSLRASFYLYNSVEEIDQFADFLEKDIELLTA